MVSYYDAVLGLIPTTFLLGSGALNVAGLAMDVAVPVAALAAVALVGHALFVRGPVDATPQ
jgi:hypothetical protein